MKELKKLLYSIGLDGSKVISYEDVAELIRMSAMESYDHYCNGDEKNVRNVLSRLEVIIKIARLVNSNVGM